MRHSPAYFGLAALVGVVALGIAALSVRAQPAPGMRHDDHGTPREWMFVWPRGAPGKGREAFVKLECYSCHEVKGETFPAPSDRGKVGPELSAMGPLHDAEYFAEAIVNPGAGRAGGGRGLALSPRAQPPPAASPAGTQQPSEGQGMKH